MVVLYYRPRNFSIDPCTCDIHFLRITSKLDANFFGQLFRLFSKQLKKIYKIFILSRENRLSPSIRAIRLNQFAANTFDEIPLSLGNGQRVPARAGREVVPRVEALITALSSDLSAAAYYSVRINPRATAASASNERKAN